MDLWIFAYLLSFGASEIFRENSPKDGLNFFASTSVLILFPYVIGRLLIEPNLRVATTKRIVLLFVCLTPAILFEYRMAQNPWLMLLNRVFHMQAGWFVQLRSGHARVAACFGDAILAGILFFAVLLLNCSLADIYKHDKDRLGRLFSKLERYRVPPILLISFLLLTRSRGPLISALVGYSVLQIPRFRNLKIGAIVVTLSLLIGGIIVRGYFDKYTSQSDSGNQTEQQTSAVYRRELLTNYQPIIEKGGWLGWGQLSFPKVQGQTSIDNCYLWIQLSQGKLGLYLFLLMATESVMAAAYSAFTSSGRENRFFAFSILAVLIGLFASLYTVYLGEQLFQFCFLLLGWSQSLRETGVHTSKFHFRRVFA